MNIQQLEYIVAVDTHRHFEKAARQCFVTQATLSMMIKKLEVELGIIIFDRSKQPVVPTSSGIAIIQQARTVLKETQQLRLLSDEVRLGTGGELRIGIIPTVAPYLLPLFLTRFLKTYPNIRLRIVEQTTSQLLKMLSGDQLDAAIMATPLAENGFMERHLFYEEFKVYVTGEMRSLKKKYILAEDIDVNKLWLLEEGHCLRSQVLNLCEIQKQQATAHHLDYETGSIETLLKITEMNGGITILPHLATIDFDATKKQKLRHFKPPVPVREISLVTFRHFIKKPLLQKLEKEIVEAVQPYLPTKSATDVIATTHT